MDKLSKLQNLTLEYALKNDGFVGLVGLRDKEDFDRRFGKLESSGLMTLSVEQGYSPTYGLTLTNNTYIKSAQLSE